MILVPQSPLLILNLSSYSFLNFPIILFLCRKFDGDKKWKLIGLISLGVLLSGPLLDRDPNWKCKSSLFSTKGKNLNRILDLFSQETYVLRSSVSKKNRAQLKVGVQLKFVMSIWFRSWHRCSFCWNPLPGSATLHKIDSTVFWNLQETGSDRLYLKTICNK